MSQNLDQQVTLTVTLPDGTTKPLPAGSTGMDIALEIGRRLAREAVAIKIDGKAVDLSAPLTADCTAEIITFDSPEGKEIFWHSASHIMHMPLKNCSRAQNSAPARPLSRASTTTLPQNTVSPKRTSEP